VHCHDHFLIISTLLILNDEMVVQDKFEADEEEKEMRKAITTALITLTLIFGIGTATVAFGQKGNNDRPTNCEKAGRERQTREIDHATGRGSERDMDRARDREARECDRDRDRGRN
jgi:hypothetical protein